MIQYVVLLFFFFSSRRRHTRFDCDWSSDVCSSDLFLSLPLALQRRLLRLLIKKSGAGLKDVGYQHYDSCISFLQESQVGGEMHLPHGNRIFKESNYFWVSTGSKQIGRAHV